MTTGGAHNAQQRDYYRYRRPRTMQPGASAYAARHFEEAAARASLSPGDRVLELGSGLGRFSIQFVDRGCALTCLELSPDLAASARETLGGRAEVIVGDALDPATALAGRFDLVAGFFFLHHILDLERLFAAARRCLTPGGRFVFVEPNPFNPLYYVQIALSPSMRWATERGMLQMRDGPISAAAGRAGFSSMHGTAYGALPRVLYDRLAPRGLERIPEPICPAFFKPFRIFTGVAR